MINQTWIFGKAIGLLFAYNFIQYTYVSRKSEILTMYVTIDLCVG